MTKIKKNRSTHVFTSRDKGPGRFIAEAAIFIVLIFALCSAYALVMAPNNPVAYSMAAFFIIGFFLLVGHEANVFPDIPNRKIPHAVITWFFCWLFVAFLASFIMTMNVSHLVFAVFFGAIVAIGSGFVVSNENQWFNFKAKTKDKTGGAIKRKVKKTKTGQKVSKKLKKRKKQKASNKKKRRIQGW